MVAALWQYIKSNRLQDSDDRRVVNLNSKLQQCFGTQQDHFEFHQLLALLKPHLSEVKPLEVVCEVERNSNYAKTCTQTVNFQAKNTKALLQFLADHDYNMQACATETEVPSDDSTLVGQLKKREVKANLKTAAAIDKLKLCHKQMQFY